MPSPFISSSVSVLRRLLLFASLSSLLVALSLSASDSPLGLFSASQDVGKVAHPGSASYDPSSRAYTLSASGENIWYADDQFQFVWKKSSGDVSLSADIAFLGKGTNAHRKAVLMIRQSLDSDAVYADIALHGSGLTSLQFRSTRGGATREVQANLESPRSLRIEKRGDYFTMWLAGPDGKFSLAGATGKIVLTPPFYVGIGLSSHEKDVVEKAVFSSVGLRESPLTENAGVASPSTTLYSMMEIIDAQSFDRRAIYVAPGRFEAPNWMPDAQHLLFNRKGRIEILPISGAAPSLLDTGFATQCNNDHGISPDGKQLVVSDNSQQDHESRVYLLPLTGGAPRLITPNAPSYWHGWSPDGKTLAFVGQRNDEFDIYSIPVTGGAETRLTTATGLDDGPEYSPDGKYIYFNSVRSGHMQIWRMDADGSNQLQITHDDLNNWFPHLSPDGQTMVFLSFQPEVQGHPENKDVQLRSLTLADGKIQVVAELFGGQGTINVPSWSPDGKHFAFVSYALVAHPDK